MASDIPLGINPRKMVPYNVMVVDSSNTERRLIQQFLRSADFKIIGEASNGKDAITHIKSLEGQVDILCIDYRLSDMTILSVMEEIRPLFPKLITLIITEFAAKEIIEEIVKLKVNAFLVKPVSKALLYEKLTALLGRKDLADKIVIGYKPVGINLHEIQIPPLQEVMNRVISFDSNRVGGSGDLETIIAPDKALCADILRIANSVYYGRSGTVSTLKSAITLIGLVTIKNIVILQFRKNFAKNLTQPLFQKHLHEIPLLTGLIAIDLSAPFGLKKLIDQIIISSTLRKVGMTILAQNLKLRYLEIIRLFEYGSKSLVQLEREELNIDHVQIGIKVFKIWKLPPSLLSVVANQSFTLAEIGHVEELDRLLRVSEILATKMLGIQSLEEDMEIVLTVFKLYQVPEDMIELFNEDYYSNIKGHPFFDSI
ncbi:MAG: HDOD domain-containing protein [Leptospiraceae bacterium]|nr:HDOD domain-containing protein [Leptospiraceae bacterium]